jgi:signal transduction histidine kinase
MTAVEAHWAEFRPNPPGPAAAFDGFRGRSDNPLATRQQRKSRIELDGETAVLEMMARGVPLPEIHGALCHAIERAVSPRCYCGIYVVDGAGPRLRTSAAPALSLAISEEICRPPVWLESSPCARALQLNATVMCDDIGLDPLWQQSEFAIQVQAEGHQSYWAVPISAAAGRALGVVAILQPARASASPVEHALIARAAELAGIAIERAQRDGVLKRSEAFLQEAQRLSATGSFSWNVITNELTWSDQLYRIFDLDPHAAVTLECLRSRVHPEDWPSLAQILRSAREGIAEIEYEHRIVLADRSYRYLHLVARGTHDEHGRLEYIGAIQDITNRRVAEEALAKARSELWHVARVVSLGALSASIAREVNQPLSGIITNASTCLKMLAANPPNVEGALETTRRTLRDGSRAAEVIGRLRVLFAKREEKTEVVDLNEAAREVIALCDSELKENGVNLCLRLAEPLPRVLGDRVQLQQVILNLLLNATDAMVGIDGRPKQLTISTGLDEQDGVRLSVTDTGVGLPTHLVPRLSEPFYTTKSNGMGIGLFVSRSIVESHEGRLCFSANEGPGVTFSFAIPRAIPVSSIGSIAHCSKGTRLGTASSAVGLVAL